MGSPERARDPRREQRDLSALADAVCRLIVGRDFPDVDVAIAKEKVRALCEELFPERMELYEMVYESRFQRLWDQWRSDDAGSGADETEAGGAVW